MTLIRALVRLPLDVILKLCMLCPTLRSPPIPRVSDILREVDDRAASLARHSKPLSAVLPKKVRRYAVADSQHFSVAQPINPDFARLCGNKAVSNKRWGSVTFAELPRLESVSQTSLEACSFSLWMMSELLFQLKRDGFNPSDPILFNTAISSVSATLSSQAHSAAAVSTFIRSKRRESLLSHAMVPVSQVQKRELMVAPGLSNGLFDQGLLEKVASQVKEDAFVSSFMSMAKLAQSGSSGKAGRNASSGSFKNTKNLFIHIALIPEGNNPRVNPNILKCLLHSPVAKGYRLVVIASRAMVCKTPTYYLILNSLAFARGCVILRSHILFPLLLILLISHHI